jgi:lysophospholipase L1-like esterase
MTPSLSHLAMMALFGPVSVSSLAMAASAAAAELPVAVAANDPRLAYMGRWDTRDGAGPRCEWSGTSVRLRFHGVAASVALKDSGNNYFQVIVDGGPTDVLRLGRGESTHALARGLPEADHTIEIFRRTEAVCGPTQVLGFRLSSGATLLDPVKRTRRIEIIGDSISCGYGNEATSQNEHYEPATENAWKAYGAITARHFDADYTCIAWSGRKMWPDNTVPGIYDLVLPTDATSRCDVDKLPRPDVIVINLSTNDFAFSIPDQAGWTGAYRDFVKRLRERCPDAFVYVASGPMMSANAPALQMLKSYLRRIVTDFHDAGDRKIAQIDFLPQNIRNGLGADWHPSAKTHQIMAQTLQDAIAGDLGWRGVE